MKSADANNFKNRSPSESIDAGLFRSIAEESCTLPSKWFYDLEIYRQEHEEIFYRTWWYQCHLTDVAKPGDYYVGAVSDQGIFIIRDDENQLHAFYNVCSHRAHQLLQGHGNTTLIVCPYHQWCYMTDGRFRGARGMDSLQDWIPDNANLKPIQLEDYGGLLFVNLDPDAMPLRKQSPKFLRDMYEVCPKLDHLVRVKRVEREIAANWKTLIDNNHECYHCDVNHKSLMELVDYDNKAVWSNDDITFTHTVERKELINTAYDVEESSIEQDSMFGFIWPNVIPLFYPGTPSLIMFQVLPTGPETSIVRHDCFLLSHDASPQEKKLMDWFIDVLSVEDVSLCENVQKGLHSRGYQQGRFIVNREHVEYSEHHVHFFQNLVKQALIG